MVESSAATLLKGFGQKERVQLSKYLSFVLRHGAQKEGIAIRPDGYVVLNDILSKPKLSKQWKVGIDHVKDVVDSNDKKRFELSNIDGVLMIRAVQGHSITTVKTEELLEPIKNPFKYAQVVHGTYYEPMPLIMASGLNKMGRNHVHLAVGLPKNEGVISGMRASCQVVIELNMVKAMLGEDRLPFYTSANNVILTEGLADGSVPAKYFRSTIDFKNKKYMYQAPFDYICVYDFECQCEDNESEIKTLNAKEIIEFPVVIIDVKAKAVKSVFHTYVKPTLDPTLTDFCTELTGIQQEQVDAGISLEQAMRNLHVFLGKEGLYQSEFVFMSCGDFDGNTLAKEAKKKNIFIPNYLSRWINIKKAFPRHLFDKCAEEFAYDFTDLNTIRQCKPVVRGMTEMLDLCQIKLEGRHHSGIDDSKNIAACAIECLKKDFSFTQGMVHSHK